MMAVIFIASIFLLIFFDEVLIGIRVVLKLFSKITKNKICLVLLIFIVIFLHIAGLLWGFAAFKCDDYFVKGVLIFIFDLVFFLLYWNSKND